MTIVDSNLHFFETRVPKFEQHRLPTIEELNKPIKTQDTTLDKNLEKSDDLFEYLHRHRPSKITMDIEKLKYFDMTNKKRRLESRDLPNSGFYFEQMNSNGKLSIIDNSDSEDETNIFKKDEFDEKLKKCKYSLEKLALTAEFSDKYNLQLFNYEKDEIKCQIRGTSKLESESKVIRKPIRGKDGKFVKNSKENENLSNIPEESKKSIHIRNSKKNKTSEYSQIKISDDNCSNDIKVEEDRNFDSDVSIIDEVDQIMKNINKFEISETLFRPFHEYWLYHCIFSRVKPKNFRLFEKQLPESFRWLLKECANYIEMTTLDLYEEICIIENIIIKLCK